MARSLRTMAEPATETMSAEEEIRSFFLEPAMDSGNTSGQPAANPEAKQGEERKNKLPREQNKGQNVGKRNTYTSGRQSWDSWQSSGSHSDTQASQKARVHQGQHDIDGQVYLAPRGRAKPAEDGEGVPLDSGAGQCGAAADYVPAIHGGEKAEQLHGSQWPPPLASLQQHDAELEAAREMVHNSEPAKAGALLMGIVKEEPAGNLLWNYLK